MKFMSPEHCAFQPERRAFTKHNFAIAQRADAPAHAGCGVNDVAHGPALARSSVTGFETGAQIHVTAAFGVDFSALQGEGADGFAHGRVGRKLLRKDFRIASAEV